MGGEIKGLSLRKFPSSSYLQWVAFLPGVSDLSNTDYMASYWSGDGGAYGPTKQRPSPHDPSLFGQQVGYMLSRDQIVALETDLCPGKFLPPFNTPHGDNL